MKPAYLQLWRSSVDSPVQLITTDGLCAVLLNIIKTVIITVKWNWYIHCSSQCLWHICCQSNWMCDWMCQKMAPNGVQQSDSQIIVWSSSSLVQYVLLCVIFLRLFITYCSSSFSSYYYTLSLLLSWSYTFPMCGTDKGFTNKSSSALSYFQCVCCSFP